MNNTTAGSTTTGNTAAIELNPTDALAHPEPKEVLVKGMFEVWVYRADKFALIPTSELAKSLLHSWLSGDCQRAGIYCGNPILMEEGYGAGLERLEFVIKQPPLLTKGGDPLYTGLALSQEEAEAARAYIDRRRARSVPKKPRRKITKRGKGSKV